jgi:hypothetical protein
LLSSAQGFVCFRTAKTTSCFWAAADSATIAFSCSEQLAVCFEGVCNREQQHAHNVHNANKQALLQTIALLCVIMTFAVV